MHAFSTPGTIFTGSGCFDRLGELAGKLGSRTLLVTGKSSMRKAGVTDRAVALLRAAGVQALLFDDIAGEPADVEIDAARRLCREERCDLVIGIGGGSAMDAAKAVAALAAAEAPTAEYILGRPADSPAPLPCIAVAATSGTGAEATPNAVLSCPRKSVKASIRGTGILPAVALVDPELTLTCPPAVTAAAGMDALTQAIESYVSIHATPLTEALSLRSFELLLSGLSRAFANGADRTAREACSYGSLAAGIALANARLGVVHGIAHPLGIRCHIPHGICCAVLLPHSIRLNRASAPGKYDRLSHIARKDVGNAVESLLDQLSIPRTFSRYNIRQADFALIAAESMPSGSLKANPKKVTEEDLIRILEQVAG